MLFYQSKVLAKPARFPDTPLSLVESAYLSSAARVVHCTVLLEYAFCVEDRRRCSLSPGAAYGVLAILRQSRWFSGAAREDAERRPGTGRAAPEVGAAWTAANFRPPSGNSGHSGEGKGSEPSIRAARVGSAFSCPKWRACTRSTPEGLLGPPPHALLRRAVLFAV